MSVAERRETGQMSSDISSRSSRSKNRVPVTHTNTRADWEKGEARTGVTPDLESLVHHLDHDDDESSSLELGKKSNIY